MWRWLRPRDTSGHVGVVDALIELGAGLVGEVAQYQDSYRLCYLRGPAGIIVALAEQLS